jgi:hypothetical protein
MRPNLWLHHNRAKDKLKGIIWSARLAGKGTLVLVPTAVLVVHLSTIPLPALPRLLHQGRLAVVMLAALTKVQGKSSLGLRHRTAWEFPSTLMAMLLWTRWQTYIATSNNRWFKQDRCSRYKLPLQCNRHRQHQCNTSNPQPSPNNCKHLVPPPHGLRNARWTWLILIYSPLIGKRPIIGKRPAQHRRHSSTLQLHRHNSSPRTTRPRTCRLHTHMRMRLHHRYTMGRK